MSDKINSKLTISGCLKEYVDLKNDQELEKPSLSYKDLTLLSDYTDFLKATFPQLQSIKNKMLQENG